MIVLDKRKTEVYILNGRKIIKIKLKNMIKDEHWKIMTKIVRWGGCVLIIGMLVLGAYIIITKIRNIQICPETPNFIAE